MKVGIDIIRIARFKKIKNDDYSHWSRVFTAAEWRYAFKDGLQAEHLAGMFAAKEAAMKASGRVGVGNFLRFEITHDKNGAPRIKGSKAAVSISTGGDYAAAVVVAK